MDKPLLVDNFTRLNIKIFPYSYSLIYDELQSQQLIIDALTIFMSKDEERLQDYLQESDVQSQGIKWFEIEKQIYRYVFQIASKRFDQVRSSLNFDEAHTQFYTLSIVQRSLLFLMHKTDFEQPDIMEIMGLDYLEFRQLQSLAEVNICVNYHGQRYI